ncbi:MAG: hypothetical protein ACOYM1_03425 [Methylovulum sp.]
MNPQLVNEITQLPPEAQREIADLAAFLTARYQIANLKLLELAMQNLHKTTLPFRIQRRRLSA